MKLNKVYFFLLFFILIQTVSTNAQYSIDKLNYDQSTYIRMPGDPYSSTLCGISSLLIPGSGQMIAHEFGRGTAFMISYAASVTLFAVAVNQAKIGLEIDEVQGDFSLDPEKLGLVVFGIISVFIVDIWATINAVKIARVKNLAWQNPDNTGLIIQLDPYVSPHHLNNTTIMQIGASLKFSF